MGDLLFYFGIICIAAAIWLILWSWKDIVAAVKHWKRGRR